MKSYCFKSVETFAQLFPKVGGVMVRGMGEGFDGVILQNIYI